MKPGVGELAVLPSIWGRKFDHISSILRASDKLDRLGGWPRRQQRGYGMDRSKAGQALFRKLRVGATVG